MQDEPVSETVLPESTESETPTDTAPPTSGYSSRFLGWLKGDANQSSPDQSEEISKGTKAELVQLIGNIIVLYKESKENKQIVLPR